MASIFRLIFSNALNNTKDWSYTKEQSSLWAFAEVSFGIICSCGYVLPRLYKHLAAIPAYGSREYEEYQRRKAIGASEDVYEPQNSRNASSSYGKLGNINSDIEMPVPTLRSWARDF